VTSSTSLSLVFVSVELLSIEGVMGIDFLYYFSELGFVHLQLNSWLELLLTCSLSIEIFSMFR
jgi:hypothetical protein